MKLILTACAAFIAIATALVCPTPAGAVEAAYLINPGDVLQITLWKEDGMDRETLVLPDGTIGFPLAGTVMAKGHTAAEVAQALHDGLARNQVYPDAHITVVVKAALGNVVDVIGQVTKPGEMQAGHRITIMQALSLAGGLTPFASEDRISILRHQPNGTDISIPFKYYKALLKGRKLDKDIELQAGDEVVVPAATLF